MARINLVLSPPAYPPPLSPSSDKRERLTVIAVDGGDLGGIGVCVTNASISRAGRTMV